MMNNYVQPRKQQKQIYYKQNQENIKNSNKKRYRASQDENRSVPQGKAAPAPSLPPLKQNKNKGKKRKAKDKKQKSKKKQKIRG